MLPRFLWRGLTELSPRIAYKALRLWVWQGLFALRAFNKRRARGELFPPFLFFALTGACNLRCRGCWVGGSTDTTLPLAETGKETGRVADTLAIGKPAPCTAPAELSFDSVDRAIRESALQNVYYHTLLGGEPFLYPRIFELIQRHPECYFQIITNGQFFDFPTAKRLRQLGNVTPLVSIDGFEGTNDARRGEGTFQTAIQGCRELQRQKLLYGVATVVTSENMAEVLTEKYVRQFIDLGAMYLWYYVFRPVGADPSTEYCLNAEQMHVLRKRLLKLRRTLPIILIDTYWDAEGYAVCPAAEGLGFHIGPQGGIEPCPPLSVSCEHIDDRDGDLFETIDKSRFLKDFQRFVRDKYDRDDKPGKTRKAEGVEDSEKPSEKIGRGCVILQHPKELSAFFREHHVTDNSGRDLCTELASAEEWTSHHLPGQEIPEDYWVYRILKKTLFFGMGAYG